VVAAGAVGYLVKSTPGPELRRALLRAAHGDVVFSPALAALVLGEFRRLARASSGAQPCRTASARCCNSSPEGTVTARSVPSSS
jgi:DNA-binding NarL/FixJ family response regulator